MIVVDWGTSNLRAYLCREDGSIVSQTQTPQGIKAIQQNAYPQVLQSALQALGQNAHQPVYISGMAGSRGGWRETPYCTTPVSLQNIAARLLPLPEPFSGSFVPGARTMAADGTIDVMRGEEIQIFGALSKLKIHDAVLCLPGTHSKWVRTKNGQIIEFATFMTGDLFQALAHTILCCDSEAHFSQHAFKTGLDAVTQTGGGILHQLFTARTRVLEGVLAAEQVSSFVSGLLIGHELSQSTTYQKQNEAVVVIGSDNLCERYRLALEHFAVNPILLGSDVATCTGIAALNRVLQEGS
ncbi:MAG: 2-dehydro-3-deoxygalactonokinase [Deltaproteobacteria bacterium]|nr:2-dehydro-3-deoxygalactonokinase [Deltaproteobacteria bacterium]